MRNGEAPRPDMAWGAHPLVFSGAIKSIDGEATEGEIAEVYSAKKQFLRLGHYQIGSIAVRMFSFQNISECEKIIFFPFSTTRNIHVLVFPKTPTT